MPQTIKDSEGNEIEVFTQEEIEGQKQEAIEAFKTENPDKTAELAELQEKMREAEEKLAKVGDKDYNFKALEKAKNDAESKLKSFTQEWEGKLQNVKKEVLEGVMSDHKNDTLKQLSGGDAELEKKIEFHYKRLGDVAGTKAEITSKLKDAWVLATKKEDDGMNASIYGSGNVGRLNINNQSPKFSAEEQELGSKFGLKPEDFKGK